MKPDLLHRRAFPVSYVLLMLDLAAERGVSREQIVAGLDIPTDLLTRPDERFSLLQYTSAIFRIWQLTRDPALGYEFGLRCSLTTHGFFGFGVMSQATMADSLRFAIRYLSLCMPSYSLRLETGGDLVSLDIDEVVPFGPVRQLGLDKFLVSFARCSEQTYGRPLPGLELWFDYPEPPYYARYRDRLPPMRFSMPKNCMRAAASILPQKLLTADPITARLVAQQCERELSLAGQTDDFLASVRAALVDRRGRFLSIDAIAEKLFTSRRTLNRRLQELGVSYRDLVDEIRHRESLRLLERSPLTVEAIALHLGYHNSNSFNRAFHRWAGMSPTAYRTQSAACAPELRRSVA